MAQIRGEYKVYKLPYILIPGFFFSARLYIPGYFFVTFSDGRVMLVHVFYLRFTLSADVELM